MKKKAFLLLMAGFVSSNIHAQSSVGTFSIIPKVGVNIAHVTNSDLYLSDNEKVGNKSYTGLMFGVDMQYQLSNTIALSAGIGYSRQGYAYGDTKWEQKELSTKEYTSWQAWTDHHHSIDYLAIPVMLKGYVMPGFAIGAGVQAGFVIDNKLSHETSSFKEYPSGLKEYSGKTEVVGYKYTSKNMNVFDFSIPISASYEYMNVVVAATYNLGLTSIFKEPAEKSRNRVVTFTVGYKFDL